MAIPIFHFYSFFNFRFPPFHCAFYHISPYVPIPVPFPRGFCFVLFLYNGFLASPSLLCGLVGDIYML